ncbi:hypothetical protein N7478_000392 [Penicillium angulare]|uniref:uncharacterized protein n=1 Tax=Penicillium angulare TaxID=116970 RepID=UPI0025401692|nr:uncharacterized protein N7478_000392 [Penicillium angulare]KAJ5291141.1 hypothetical protein N7478_000392 [Penicillium angulare]
MAKHINNHSSNCNQMTWFLDQESTVLASCYSVESSSTLVQGFHYCTTLGSGSKLSARSPPLDIPTAKNERNWPGNTRPEYKGEATYTIPEECERLFCDKLFKTFLGEGAGLNQESLGMGAFKNIQPHQIGLMQDRIQKWIEVWDYTSDAIYRGFVADMDGERTLFVFLEDGALSHGLKSG